MCARALSHSKVDGHVHAQHVNLRIVKAELDLGRAIRPLPLPPLVPPVRVHARVAENLFEHRAVDAPPEKLRLALPGMVEARSDRPRTVVDIDARVLLYVGASC